jgi:hypothetical protein
LAADAIVEGEARLHETRYRASADGLDPAVVDWTRRFAETVRNAETFVLMQPSPYSATRRAFPYEWGARYMHFSWQAGGSTSVSQRFASPPTTSRTLMASVDSALDPEAAPGVVTTVTAPPEWTPLADTTLGAWGTFLMLAKNTSDVDRARALALGWRADRFSIYGDAASATALVWRIEFSDAATAQAAASIALMGLGASSVRQFGSSMIIARTDGAQALDWAFSP